MPDLESVKEEFDKLDNVDKRWIAICAVVAVAALVTAAMAGSLLGDLIAFVLTFAAGWFVHEQWDIVRSAREAPDRAGVASASATPFPAPEDREDVVGTMQLGVGFSGEELGPDAIVRAAAHAEEAGFGTAWVSDHFHPWIDAQGESPFVWSVLGGIAAVTEQIRVGTGVTCPIIRVHPVILAQAAATTQRMFNGRFWFGVGSGEALNEHIVARHWPETSVRLEMLEEAVSVIRRLWSGQTISHSGAHFSVENARIYTLPDEAPPIYVSAFGPKAAEVATRIGDGLVCTQPDDEVISAFEGAGGSGPKLAQVKVVWAESVARGEDLAYERWPTSGLSGELSQVLPTPAHFEQAVSPLHRADIVKKFACGPDPARRIEAIQPYVDAGYDEIYVTQVGPDQDGFLAFYEREVLPHFSAQVDRVTSVVLKPQPPPVDLQPMLATLVTEVPLGTGWSYEMKWDGVHTLMLVRGGKVRVTSRAGRDITAGYPEFAELGVTLRETDVLLDGEIVALDEQGRPSFQLLQRRMHVRDAASVRALQQEVPVAYMIFDLLWLDGTLTTELPYTERRRVLEALELRSTRWQTPPTSTEHGEAALATSRELGLEGIVAKRLDSKYESGRRSSAWRKVKHALRQEFVIGGWSPGQGGRSGRVGALLLGYHDAGGDLRYAGKVGTGFSDAELDRLDALFAPLEHDGNPFTGGGVPRVARFVEPTRVAEVRFTEWTDSGRIRHPAYLGLRDDKRAIDVVREG